MSKQIKVVKMPNVYGRYIIVNPNTSKILDDAQGYGYRSPQKAHKHLIDDWDDCLLDIYKNGEKADYSDFKHFMSEYDPEFSGSIRSLYLYLQHH